jgi:hypothetical protein
MSRPLDIVIVERVGTLKSLSVKDFKVEELYKKCGFKKVDGFERQAEWNVKCDGTRYWCQLYAKADGRANTENKYDFPPPVDTKLFFGSCVVVALIKKETGEKEYTNLSVALWNKIYEKLFGGFEDLSKTAKEDEEEEDELANIPKEKKTKDGYLKDGFVVDSSDTESTSSYEDSDDEDEDDDVDSVAKDEEEEESSDVDDAGSELSEESYDYEDENVAK